MNTSRLKALINCIEIISSNQNIDQIMLERMQQQLNESYQIQCDLVARLEQSDSKVQELSEVIQRKENLFRGREEYLLGKMSELKAKIEKLQNQESQLTRKNWGLKQKVDSLKKSKNKYSTLYLKEIEERSKLENELATANEISFKKQKNILNVLINTELEQAEPCTRKRYFKN